MDFKNLFKKAIKHLEAKNKLASMVEFEKKNQKIEDLVKKCNNKARTSSTLNHYIILFLSWFTNLLIFCCHVCLMSDVDY